MLFNEPFTIFSLLSLSLLFLIIGYLMFSIFNIAIPPSINVNSIILYEATGFIISLLLLNIIATFEIGNFSLIFLGSLISFAILYLIMKNKIKIIILFYKIRKLEIKKNGRRFLLFDPLISLLLMVFTFFHFAIVISQMNWPPIGDILSLHGPLTSLLLYNKKIITTLEPLSSLPLHYPIGFHVVAANVASWFHLFPGEAVFLLGGIIIILIPLLVYCLTYTLTKSPYLSFLAYLSTFIIHPSGNLERWIVGFFYNGPYPNLTAFMIIIFSICILTLAETGYKGKKEKREVRNQIVKYILILFFALLALLLVYPSFCVFTIILIISLIVKYQITPLLFFRKTFIMISFLLAGLTLLALPKAYVYSVKNIEYGLLSGKLKIGYGINRLGESFLFDHITGYIMLIALVISLILLLRKKHLAVNLVYIILFCCITVALNSSSPTILDLILPSRAMMIPWVLSWPIFLFGVARIIKIKKLLLEKKKLIYALIFIILLIIPQFSYSIIKEFFYINAQQYGWHIGLHVYYPYYSRKNLENYENYIALLWINYNIPSDERILNDLSWTGYWILSFSVKNVTFFRQLDTTALNRAKELKVIWEKPYEKHMVYQLLKKYDVHYIFVTSECGYYDAPELGGDGRYKSKLFSPSEYINIFDNYSFLKVALRLGTTTIYKVEFN